MASVRCCPPHLDAVLGGLAHGQEVRHNVGHQVSAHLYSGAKVILEQTARQLHRFNLRNKDVWRERETERDGEKEGEVRCVHLSLTAKMTELLIPHLFFKQSQQIILLPLCVPWACWIWLCDAALV